MARRFVSIKPIDQVGVDPSRPSDEVAWEELSNVWFDVGILKKRPSIVTAAHTSIAGTCTESPGRVLVEFTHPVTLDATNTIRPTGDSSVTDNDEWTVGGGVGSTKWDKVDDVVTVDADYIESNVIDDKQSFVMSNSSLTILDRLIINVRAKRRIEGDYTITAHCTKDPAGTPAVLDICSVVIPHAENETETWEDFEILSATDPHTSATWTTANVNAYEFGIRMSARDTSATTEILWPAADGATYSDFSVSGGADYTLLDKSTYYPDFSTYSSYVYQQSDDQKLSFSVGSSSVNWATITSVAPIAQWKDLVGYTKYKLRVKSGATEEAVSSLLTVAQPEPIPGAPIPEFDSTVTFADITTLTHDDGTAPATTDPITSAAWEIADIEGYEWVVHRDGYITQQYFVYLVPENYASAWSTPGDIANAWYEHRTAAPPTTVTNGPEENLGTADVTCTWNHADLPTSIDYDSIVSLYWTIRGFNTQYYDETVGWVSPAGLRPRMYITAAAIYDVTTYQAGTIQRYGDYTINPITSVAFTEADINNFAAEVYYVGSSALYSYMDLTGYSASSVFKPVSSTALYAFGLKLAGTAAPIAQVSKFNITVEGATGSGRRVSQVLVTATDIQRYDDTATLTDVIGTATNPTASSSTPWDTSKFFGKQYFTNGVDNIYRYPNGSDEVDELTTVHKCTTLASFIGRLFTGTTTETGTKFPDRVRWSAIEDDSTWSGTGTGYLDLNDTDGEIVKLLPLGGVLVAYKETSIYNLHPTGDRDSAVVKNLVSPGVGAVAPNAVLSVVHTDGLPAHVFLGQGKGGYNVYMYTGTMLIPLGDQIKEELRDNANPDQIHNSFALVDNKRNQYVFFIPYAGEQWPSKAWTYDVDSQTWKQWTVNNPTCAGLWKTDEVTDAINEWTLLLGQQNSLVRRFDVDAFQDANTTPITTKAVSGDWAIDDRNKYVTLYRIWVYYYDKGYTPINTRVSLDGGDTWSTAITDWIGQADGSADGSLRLKHIDMIETGRRFRFELVHNDNTGIQVSEVLLEIEDQGYLV